ncbi:MAG: HEPN-associated N-terminal domain-containing protein [Endomicrobiaceae bacterium]|nr:HEPN-associated N-terminal domain-containing protein [Endomicrobiaceae bacterium]
MSHYSDLSLFQQGILEYKDEYICENCIKESNLEEIIYVGLKSKHNCKYCGTATNNVASIYDLLESIKYEIEQEYVPSIDKEPWEDGQYVSEQMDNEDIINDLFSIENDQLREDILKAFINESYSKHTKSDEECDFYLYSWETFQKDVSEKYRYTFLSQDDHKNFLNELKTYIINESLFKIIEPNSKFHRVRKGIYKNIEELCPPSKEETKDFRMNPKGIPMFYCSSEEETAIKETNISLIQSKTIAEFYNIKDLIILDLSEKFCICPDGRIKFLHYFVQDISKPLNSKDKIKLLYIPTQILTEYFRYFLKYKDKNIDGICYRSSLNNKLNYVFFYDKNSFGKNKVFDLTTVKHIKGSIFLYLKDKIKKTYSNVFKKKNDYPFF